MSFEGLMNKELNNWQKDHEAKAIIDIFRVDLDLDTQIDKQTKKTNNKRQVSGLMDNPSLLKTCRTNI